MRLIAGLAAGDAAGSSNIGDGGGSERRYRDRAFQGTHRKTSTEYILQRDKELLR